MPLAFNSKSHGTIAFGFFNIETNMLLLEDLYFFADHFCQAVSAITATDALACKQVEIEGWQIDNREATGNLDGAIEGIDLSGFIGATYQHYPFPTDPEKFKQNPDGDKNQDQIKRFIHKFGVSRKIELKWNTDEQTVHINRFAFANAEFKSLVAYVCQGGFPRWKDAVRPAYVEDLLDKLKTRSSIFYPAPNSVLPPSK